MSTSQLQQPLNIPSNNNLTNNNGYNIQPNPQIAVPNVPPPMNNNNNLMNNQGIGNNNKNGLNGQMNQQKPGMPQTGINGARNQQQNVISQRNCKLFVIYLLSGLLSLAGFIVSLIFIIKASELYPDFEVFALPEAFDVKFNFVMLYNPFSGIASGLCAYLMYLSNQNDGRNINYSQTITLITTMLAFIFGVVNFTQKKGDIPSCSGSSTLCQFLNIYSAYDQMVIPISLIPFLLLAGAQYLLYRLKQTPPVPQNPIKNNLDLELQQKNLQPNANNLNKPNGLGMNMQQQQQQQQLGGLNQNPINGAIPNQINQQKGTYQNSRPSMLQTDQKLGDIKSRNSINNLNNDLNNINNNFGKQDPISFQNPVQKFNNQVNMNGRSDSIVNNFGVPMYQQPKIPNQIDLEYKQISTPREDMYQGLNGNMNNMNMSSTPTPNLGQSSATKLNQNNYFDNSSMGQDFQNQIKTSVSQFTNTPMKSPSKSISPIDKAALISTQQKSIDNIGDQITNTDYNPYGKTEKGEIQIGQHPYILGAKDPYVGQILDQVQAMVNNQVKSLLIELKKQNKY